MKKLIFLLILTGIIQTVAKSQGCLPNGITFTSQSEIDSFQIDYPGCSIIEGNVTIEGQDIINLSGLNGVTSINGFLGFINNGVLQDLTGLNNLSSIGGLLAFNNNDSLTSFSGLDNLASIGGELKLFGTKVADFSGLGSLTYIGSDLHLENNLCLKNLNGLNNVNHIGGDLNIWNNDSLINLTGIENITAINGNLFIGNDLYGGNNSLSSLNGLNNIIIVNGNFEIYDNDNLSSVDALNSLTEVTGYFHIGYNENITCLTSLSNLESIGDHLGINYNSSLNDLSSLFNLVAIGGTLGITNDSSLTSLSGLDNISASTIEHVYIFNNPLLTHCAIQSLCDYINLPNSFLSVSGNGEGCSDNNQLIQSCQTISVREGDFQKEFEFYPNPAKKVLNILSNTEIKINKIIIYNYLGQEVIHQINPKSQINISTLAHGIYVIEFRSKETRFTGKLIIKE